MSARRSIAALCLVTGLVTTAGACSVPTKDLTAVWIGADGIPVAEIRPCDGDRAYGLTLESFSDTPSGAATVISPGTAAAGTGAVRRVNTSWSVGHRDGVSAAGFPLFSPPAAWKVRTKGPQELRPGHRYSLDFRGDAEDWDTYNSWLDFTLEDLKSLKPGEVWNGDAVTREEFEKTARDMC
ncbi:hypothetical protein ACWDR0_04815 [Streptomyces sp. NPDC003691]